MSDPLSAVILRAVRALRGQGLPVLALQKFKKHIYTTSNNYFDTFVMTISFVESSSSVSLSAGTWKTLLDVAGSGVFRGFAFTANGVSTAGSKVTARVTLDGRVFEEALNVESGLNQVAILALGCSSATSGAPGSAVFLSVKPNGAFTFAKALKIELQANYAAGLTAYTDYNIGA